MNAAMTATIFGCSPAQAEAQMWQNIAGLEGMQKKAEATGRKVNGYTSGEIAGMIAKVKKNWNLRTSPGGAQ